MNRYFRSSVYTLFLMILLSGCGPELREPEGSTPAGPATVKYTVGGSVSGLSGSGLVLVNNNTDEIAVFSNMSFTFETELSDGATYNVSVRTQPSGPPQICTTTNNAGTIAGTNVEDVSIYCAANFNFISPLILTAFDGAAYDDFGYSVSVSADGNTIVSGAPWKNNARGEIYIFKKYVDVWHLSWFSAGEAENSFFGGSVSVSSDGNTVFVGANWHNNNRGTAYIYTYDESSYTWTQTKLLASDGIDDDEFGFSVFVSPDGKTILVGAPGKNIDRGAVYVYKKNGANWNQYAILTSTDPAQFRSFGKAVSTSSDGNTIIVGAIDRIPSGGAGAVYIYTWDGTVWEQTKLVDPLGQLTDNFSRAVSISQNGKAIIVGAPGKNAGAGSRSGAAFVYSWNGAGWSGTMLTASDGAQYDEYGHAVSVSSDGTRVMVGSASAGPHYEGAVYHYNWNGSIWAETKLTIPGATADEQFGDAVSMSSDANTAVIGAVGNNTNSGAVYVFHDDF